MWKANGKTTTLQLFLDSVSPKNMRDASSGDKLKIALFGDLSFEEAKDLSRDRQILELGTVSFREKLTVAQQIKKFCVSYGTRRFITVFTRARHWTIS
jgi:hypothetical protein